MNLINFFLFALIASITPGPANIAILSVSSVSSIRSGVFFIFGICIGFSLVLLISLLPLIGLISINPDSLLVNSVKIIGGVFLLYISYTLYNKSSFSSDRKIGFIHGLIIHPTSIKGWAFVFSAYTLFMDTDSFSLEKGLIYASIFLFAAIISHSIWFSLGVLIKNSLPEKKVIVINKFLSASLAATVIYVFI